MNRSRSLVSRSFACLAVLLAGTARADELFKIANLGTAPPVGPTATSLLLADGFALVTTSELPFFGPVSGEREKEVFRVGPDLERFSFVADLCSGRCDGYGVVAAVEVDGETFFGVRRFSTLPPGPAPALGWGICAVASTGGSPRCLAEGNAGELIALTDRVLFTLAPADGAGGYGPEALGATDGTSEGTLLLATPPRLSRLVRVGEAAFFLASATGGGVALWRSDGTAGGTASVAPVPAAVAPGWEPVVAGGRLFFVADGGLWTSDGTAPGTRHLLGGLAAETVLFPAGSRVFFARRKGGKVQLFTSDGSKTRLLAAIQPPGLDFEGGRAAIGLDGRFLFANRVGSREELWTSDGTPAGTRLLSRLGAGQGHGLPRAFATVGGGRVVFTAGAGGGTRRPWVTDGSPGRTRPLPFPPLSGPFVIQDFFAGDGIAFAHVGSGFARLFFRTDGTPAGSALFQVELPPGQLLGGFGVLGRTLLYSIRDLQLGATTGFGAFDVARGSRPLPPPLGVDARSAPRTFAVADDRLFFAASASAEPYPATLWQWNGVDPPAPALSGPAASTDVERLDVAGDRLFITTESRLWAFADGTAVELGGPSGIREVVAAGENVFFLAQPNASELGWSDGTVAGTRILAAGLSDGSRSLTPSGTDAFLLTGPLFDPGGAELWWSDGTPEGTGRAVRGVANLAAPRLAVLDGEVFYASATRRNELWAADGTRGEKRLVATFGEPGEARIEAVVAATGGVYALVDEGGPGPILWWSDGREAVRRLLDLPAWPGELAAPIETQITFEPLLAVGPSVAFTLDDGVHGEELWWSDGTVEGTGLVADLCPGPCSSLPAQATVVGDLLAFAAVGGGATGLEGWVSDGTEAGTLPLPEVAPGPRGSYPRSFAAFRDLLVFSADDGASGSEPWAYRP